MAFGKALLVALNLGGLRFEGKDPKSVSPQKSLAILTILLVGTLAALSGGTAVYADDPHTTQAEVVATGGSAPILECKWELPDMDLATAGIQYIAPGPGDFHDDDPATVPDDGNLTLAGRQAPCDLARDTAGNATGQATMRDNVHHMIQVNAPPHVLPAAIPFRDIELWVAAEPFASLTSPTGDVYWDVFERLPAGHPGCVVGFGAGEGDATNCWGLKVQVHYNSGPVAQNDFGAVTGGTAQGLGAISGSACNNYGPRTPPNPASTPVNESTMFTAAIHSGQLTTPAVLDTVNSRGIIPQCVEGVKGLFHAKFQLDKDEACGEFKIIATATVNTVETRRTNYIDIPCNFYLQSDFTTVNWGQVTLGVPKYVVLGDDTFGSGGPTIANGNNGAMGVRVKFTSMSHATGPKKITDFDVCFGRAQVVAPVTSAVTAAANNCEDPISILATGDATVDLSDDDGVTNDPTPVDTDPNPRYYVLCANETGKLDFSLHPNGSLDAGNYTGTVTVIGYAVTDICYGDIHPAEPITVATTSD